jgi:hypothetical protein
MSCPKCSLGNQVEFSAEIVVHFSGLRNLDKPGVLLFSKLKICLDCGSAEFTVPETELALLASAPPSQQLTMAAAG